jgi:hypothetical protein
MVLVGEIDRPRRLLARAIAVPPAETAGEEFRVSEILARLQQQAIYNESTSERLNHFFAFPAGPNIGEVSVIGGRRPHLAAHWPFSSICAMA